MTLTLRTSNNLEQLALKALILAVIVPWSLANVCLFSVRVGPNVADVLSDARLLMVVTGHISRVAGCLALANTPGRTQNGDRKTERSVLLMSSVDI